MGDNLIWNFLVGLPVVVSILGLVLVIYKLTFLSWENLLLGVTVQQRASTKLRVFQPIYVFSYFSAQPIRRKRKLM